MKRALWHRTILLGAMSAPVVHAQTAEPTIKVTGSMSGGDLFGGSSTFASRPVRADPSSYKGLSNTDRFRATLIDFATCLRQADRSSLGRIVSGLPGSPNLARIAKASADNRCLAIGDFSFRPSELYRAASVVRYRDRNSAGPPAMPETPVDSIAAGKGLTGDPFQIFVSSLRFGDCVVRRDVKTAHALIITAPGSVAENAAFSAVAPGLSACLASGTEMKLTKEFIKGLLADVMNRSVAG